MPRSTRTRAPIAACLLLLAWWGVWGSGCVADNGGGRGSRASQRPPADARAERVVPVVSGQFVDTDGNAYRDTNQVIVYVFTGGGYAIPIEADGAFEFTLTDRAGRPIRRWTFTRDEAAQRRARLPAGPGFVFTLSLLSGEGGDTVSEGEADLFGVFTPLSGDLPIRFRTSAAVVIGRVRSSND